MSTEDEILNRLLQGYTPSQLIDEGFKKSTVYKVYQKVKVHSSQTNKPQWLITNISPAEPRALPGQKASISFQFENNSGKDLYLYRIGIWTEWMQDNMWIAQEVKDLIKSGQRRIFSFLLLVPDNISLGEYTMSFGVEVQYLPASEYQPLQTQWTEPLVFHVKRPFMGISIFLSYSTQDMTLIRQLEKQLDNYGIKVIIAEDTKEPGTELRRKFESKIRESTIFLALLTEHGINSKWVLRETDYAKQINKPLILLKEESVSIESDYEWVSFSKNDPPEILFQKVMDAISYMQRARPGVAPASSIGPILGVAILAFLFGLFIGSKD
jgi:hypothetical protein